MTNSYPPSELIQYLNQTAVDQRPGDKIPPLHSLSDQLNISVSRLREQLEAAKVLGFVDVRPRVGIRRLEYSFTPAVQASLNYAIRLEDKVFEDFLDLRRHLENAYFLQAGRALTAEDHEELKTLVAAAWKKLQGTPVRIPHQEHRQFHLTIYRRLENVFVTGLIEAYWDAYETVGLNVYADISYLEEVWEYHEKISQSLAAGRIEEGRQFLKDHFVLLIDRLAS
ncbi:MAG: FCD domain-containing protein [Anaerolineales bacterium]|nr:FCD domain-containing protein [Anaerolineales bacterium]